MLTTGISCTHITVTIVSIAIIKIKASDVSTQQIILKGFGSLWLVLAAIPASKSISHNISIMRFVLLSSCDFRQLKCSVNAYLTALINALVGKIKRLLRIFYRRRFISAVHGFFR